MRRTFHAAYVGPGVKSRAWDCVRSIDSGHTGARAAKCQCLDEDSSCRRRSQIARFANPGRREIEMARAICRDIERLAALGNLEHELHVSLT